MKKQICQAKSEAKSWDDLIEFTEAKIKELKEALQVFKRSKEAGHPWLGDKKAGTTDAIPAVNRNTVTPNVA